MSNLSELLPSGGGQNQVEFVASGTLPNGKPVVLKSNGQIEVITETSISQSIPSSSEVVFSTSNPEETHTAFDPNTPNKFVVGFIYSGKGYISIGTVSGTSISMSSGIIFNDGTTGYLDLAFDPNTAGKFVVVFSDGTNSNRGYARAGNISGASISFGSKYVYNTGTSYVNRVAFDPNTENKFVVAYRDVGNSSYGTACVGTLSSTNDISFGSEVVFNTAEVNYVDVAFDQKTANKCVITYTLSSGNNYGTARVGTVSGTSISFGTAAVFNSGTTYYSSVAFDPSQANKCLVIYRDASNNNYGTAILGTTSGTSISFGSEVVFYSAAASYESFAFDPNTTGKFVVAYQIGGTAYAHVSVGTLSGNSISFGSSIQINAGDSEFFSVSFDSNAAAPGKFVVTYRDTANSSYATARLGQIGTSLTNLTSTNLIGIAAEAASSGATAKINTWGGINESQTSLTIGSDYYAQTNGTITTASASPAQRIGTAISATQINIKDFA